MATLLRNRSMKPNSTRGHRSKLLTTAENNTIHGLINKGSVSLVTTVAEVYLTKAPDYNCWIKEATGVLCLIQTSREDYVFYLYSLERNVMIWYSPVDHNSDYRSDISFFHMFQGENCVVGLNFANISEAKSIRDAIRIYINRPDIDSKFIVQKPNTTPTSKKQDKKKGRNKTLVISNPLNFKHIAHVSFDQKSFNYSENALLTEIFKRAGVTEAQLSDRKTREFMFNFVQKKQSRKKYRAPPPPQTPTPTPPESNQFRQNPVFTSLPTRPSPLPPSKKQWSFSQSQSPAATSPRPPRPPPLPQHEVTEDKMVSNITTPVLVVPDSRSALLESIRKGGTLKPVKTREIRPVDDEELFKDDIAAALSKAIRIREKALQNNDSFSESDVESDEWDS